MKTNFNNAILQAKHGKRIRYGKSAEWMVVYEGYLCWDKPTKEAAWVNLDYFDWEWEVESTNGHNKDISLKDD